MKTYSKLLACGVAAIAASGLSGLGSSWAQEAAEESKEDTFKDAKPRPAKVRVIEKRGEAAYGRGGMDRGGYGGGGYGGGYGGRYGGREYKVVLDLKPQMEAIREAAAALSDAEDDEAREAAEEKLGSLLDDYFEMDMNRREEELAAVEKRVKQLRELLERRREKKDDIIKLQVEVLHNEANGLGFFSADGPEGKVITPQMMMNILQHPPGQPFALPATHPPVPRVPGTPAAPAVAPVPVNSPRPR